MLAPSPSVTRQMLLLAVGVTALQLSSPGQARGRTCALTERTLIGSWIFRTTENGETDSRELSFEVTKGGAHEFHSWLHARPEYDGSWRIRGCVVQVSVKQGGLLEFRVRSGRALRLVESDGADEVSYRKMRQ